MKLTRMMGTLLVAALVSLAPAAREAHALAFTMDDILTGVPGDTLAFTGTFANLDDFELFLNGTSITLDLGLTGDDTPFFVNVPATLAPFGEPGASIGPVDILLVSIGLLPIGTYSGTFSVLGGASGSAQDVLATQDFAVQVVPEPATVALLGTGLLYLAARQRRRVLHRRE